LSDDEPGTKSIALVAAARVVGILLLYVAVWHVIFVAQFLIARHDIQSQGRESASWDLVYSEGLRSMFDLSPGFHSGGWLVTYPSLVITGLMFYFWIRWERSHS
jgi:hypothetical protein